MGDDETESASELIGEGSELAADPSESTAPPILSLEDVSGDGAFNGENTQSDIDAAVAVMAENEFTFNSDELVNAIGECSQIDGGVVSQFLGLDVLVEPESSKLTPAPHVSCKLTAARDPLVVVGWFHFSPNSVGFGTWPTTNAGTDLAGITNLGKTAGWSQGNGDHEYFSIIVVEEGDAQLAMEFRTYDGESNQAGKIPGMIGALSKAAKDISTS